MKKIFAIILALILTAMLLAGCDGNAPAETTAETTAAPETTQATPAESTPNSPESKPETSQNATTPGETSPETPPASETAPSEEKEPEGLSLNGIEISEYTIVYGKNCTDYEMRAANYIRDQIFAITGKKLSITTDTSAATAHEIVVGETERAISAALDTDAEGVQFSLMAMDGSLALEGDYFVIAAAAYYFVETYIDEKGDNALPTEATVCEPIVEEAKNFIFLIGDGMGLYQTLLFDYMDSTTVTYSDGEDLFYGYMLPYMGLARTDSLTGVTDSAAAGTALATGFKTTNGRIGKNALSNDVRSLTEIAGALGMATAVMSTEPQTGATPSSFSAHANDRNDTGDILASQAKLVEKYGTIIKCDYNVYGASEVRGIERGINETLATLSENEKGFFLMYEEAHIDKYCHSNDINGTFKTVVRFNQAIGTFMEYAFYNPDTFVIITADHETGKLLPNGKGIYTYGSGDHTAMYVPVFTYGYGSELFDGRVIENVQIPKTIASFWGYKLDGTNIDKYPVLTK